ncbi:MAG: hypothetical protein PGN07_06895 [Aeromicrobium erythreum]
MSTMLAGRPARRPRVTRAVLVVLAVTALLLGGACSSDEDDPAPKVPKGFEVPSGVTITDAGSTVAVGKTATVVYDPGAAPTAVSVRVDSITKGSIKDFRFFSLDASAKKSVPYYVRVTARNRGPAGLGGATLPIFARSSANTLYPANELVGSFKPCPTAKLPQSFLAGANASICLIYLIPEGEKLASIDIQPGSEKDAVRVKP